jgi:mRNA interferase RelE/StbE
MGSYRIEWKRSAVQDLRGLPKDVISRILSRITQLGVNPYPHGVRSLEGLNKHIVYDKAIIESYTITKATLTIEILRIGHRKEVYDR